MLSAAFAISSLTAHGEALDTAAFGFKFPVTVSGYAGSTELNGFPVLVTLAADSPTGFNYADCAANGADLRFADASGALIPHEIETWDSSGTSYVWVKLPSLVGTATTFTAYYGADDATALPSVDSTNVWSRYAAVFHGGAAITDATGHATAITSNGAKTFTSGGKAGGVMQKGSGWGVAFSNPLTSGALSSIDNFSFSGWFKKDSSYTGSSVVLVNKYRNDWNKIGFYALVQENKGTDYFSVGVGDGNDGIHQGTPGKGALINGEWGHLAFSYDKGAALLNSYFNGANIYSTDSARNILDPGYSTWGFGGHQDNNTYCFRGQMDEVRVLNGTASADWIKAEYDSVDAPDTFAVRGAVEKFDPTAPVLGIPTLARNSDGTFTVSVEVSRNAPAAIVCTVGNTDFAMTTTDAALPETYTAIVSGLAAGTCTATVRATATSGTEVSAVCPTVFHVGALAATVVADADEATLSPGVFRIARADAAATGLPALTFGVAFSGDAVAAVAALDAMATIPAGEAYVDLYIAPVYTTDVDADVHLVLTVSGDTVGESSTATMTVVNSVIDPTVRYVATTGDDANPGTTPELSKATIAAAVESLDGIVRSLPCTVRVAPGRYPISTPVVLTNAISVLGMGADPSRVVVSNAVNATWTYQDQRIFRINHADALVANLTMQKGQDYSDGGNFSIGSVGGMVSNCVVEAGYTRNNGRAGGGWLEAGVVTHTVFRGNTSNSESVDWQGNRPGVLQLNGSARAENCLFAGNDQYKAVTLINLADSSVMRNCTIVDSGLQVTNDYCKEWSALRIGSGATVQNVVVAGVTNTVDGAAVLPTGTVANFANGAVDGAIEGLGFPEGTVTGTAALFFKDHANGDYTPKTGGPLVGMGANYEGMAAVDLAGKTRLAGSKIDIGCYESPATPLMLIIR